MKVGHTVRQYRESKKYSQEYMAERLKMSVNGYGKIERNEVDVNIERLQEIARTLEVEPETLLKENSPVINNYGTHQHSFSVINEQSTKLIQLYEDKIKLLEDKVRMLEDAAKK